MALLDRMSAFHHTLIDKLLEGKTQTQIAQELGRTTTTISLLTRDPMVQNELALRRRNQQKKVDQVVAEEQLDAYRVLQDNAILAANKLVTLMEDSDHRIQLSAAQDILDRTYGKDAKAGGHITVLEPGSIQTLIQVLKEDGGDELAERIQATRRVPLRDACQDEESNGFSPGGMPSVIDPEEITLDNILGVGK